MLAFRPGFYLHNMTTTSLSVAQPARPAQPPRAAQPAGTARNAQRDFFVLSRRIKDAGLMDRRPGWYAARAAVLVAGFAGATTLLLTLGPTP